jgi:hypothetical protein
LVFNLAFDLQNTQPRLWIGGGRKTQIVINHRGPVKELFWWREEQPMDHFESWIAMTTITINPKVATQVSAGAG